MKSTQHGFRKQPRKIVTGVSLPVIQELLRRALTLHQAGSTSHAEQLYRQILAIDAHHADSLHLLGMIDYQAGRHESAIRMIRRAIQHNNRQAAYHSNLGTIYHALVRLEDAAASYSQALTLQPNLATAHYNLGNVLQAQGRLHEARASYERALQLNPRLAEAHYNLGNLLQAQGKLDEAIQHYELALAIEPAKYEALHNLGNALQAQHKLEDARRCYERVLTIAPAYAKAHYSRATILHSQGNVDEALQGYKTALELDPQLADAAFAESLALLLKGDLATGWRGYESRWRTKEHTPPMRAYSQPLWRGEKLQTGRVLIWGEQGIGDEIMFASLIPEVIATGNRCVLDCDVRLKPLFERSFFNFEHSGFEHSGLEHSFAKIEIVSSRDSGDDPAFNHGSDPEMQITAHLPSGSLPGLFRPDLASFATTKSPYLFADAVERERFRSEYADGRRLVGITWYTNNRKSGKARSIDLELLKPLFAMPDIRWISLQYGNHDWIQDQATSAVVPLWIDRRVNQFSDFDLFAAQVAAMDLVITIDNSTAHLAGALGIPTWVLLPFASDWRWLEQREDSPWYPSLRLFRQQSLGDWRSAIQRVEMCLDQKSKT